MKNKLEPWSLVFVNVTPMLEFVLNSQTPKWRLRQPSPTLVERLWVRSSQFNLMQDQQLKGRVQFEKTKMEAIYRKWIIVVDQLRNTLVQRKNKKKNVYQKTIFCREKNNAFYETTIFVWLVMELFGSRRWSLYWPMQKNVLFMTNRKKYVALAWKHSMLVWLLGRSSCSSPTSRELHGLVDGSPSFNTTFN